MSPMFKKAITIALFIFVSMTTINLILVDHSRIIFIPPDWGILMKLGVSLCIILTCLIIVKVYIKKK